MKILLSNDDGVTSIGMAALADGLRDAYELCIAAPDRERSAVSRAMTLFNPLHATRVVVPTAPEVPAYSIDGTPVDCVRLALGNLFSGVDMVVSGINHGPNLGTDVLYSGTVAAAHEAALLGLQAVAISIFAHMHQPKHLETAAHFARLAVEHLRRNPLPYGMLLNVNVPDCPLSEVKGVRTVPACIEEYVLPFVEERLPDGTLAYHPPRGKLTQVSGQDVDERWCAEGYAVLTPLTYDLTAFSRMEGVASDPIWNGGNAGWIR